MRIEWTHDIRIDGNIIMLNTMCKRNGPKRYKQMVVENE